MVIKLFTGVLNDDTLSVATDGKALLEYWTYATEWSDNLHKKLFSDIESALRWYRREFHDRVLDQGEWWLQDDHIEDYPYTPEQYWTDMVHEQGVEI